MSHIHTLIRYLKPLPNMTSPSTPSAIKTAIAALKPLANQMIVRQGSLHITVGNNLADEGVMQRIDEVSSALKTLGADQVEIQVGASRSPSSPLPAGAEARAVRGVNVCCHIVPKQTVTQVEGMAAHGLDLKALADNGINFPGSASYLSPTRST